MVKILFIFIALTTFAQAQSKIGFMASYLHNVPDTDLDGVSGVDEETEAGIGIGMRALVPITNNVFLRSGAGFVEKNFGYEFTQNGTSGSVDASLSYLSIPATLYLTGMDQRLGVFAGTSIYARLADDCDPAGVVTACDDFDPKTLVFPAVLGFEFIFSERYSLELSYEYGFMDSAKDVKLSSAVISFIYSFQ